jgi:hypothetical protein
MPRRCARSSRATSPRRGGRRRTPSEGRCSVCPGHTTTQRESRGNSDRSRLENCRRRGHASRRAGGDERRATSERHVAAAVRRVTDVIPLQRRVAAGLRHEPLYDVEMTMATRRKKGRGAFLATMRRIAAQKHSHRQNEQRRHVQRRREQQRTDAVALRCRVAVRARHEPLYDGEAAVGARRQKGGAAAYALVMPRHSAETAATQTAVGRG